MKRWLKLVSVSAVLGAVIGIAIGFGMDVRASSRGHEVGYCSVITEANQGYCEEVTRPAPDEMLSEAFAQGYEQGHQEALALAEED